MAQMNVSITKAVPGDLDVDAWTDIRLPVAEGLADAQAGRASVYQGTAAPARLENDMKAGRSRRGR